MVRTTRQVPAITEWVAVCFSRNSAFFRGNSPLSLHLQSKGPKHTALILIITIIIIIYVAICGTSSSSRVPLTIFIILNTKLIILSPNSSLLIQSSSCLTKITTSRNISPHCTCVNRVAVSTNCNMNASFSRFFYWKCRKIRELPLKNDDFCILKWPIILQFEVSVDAEAKWAKLSWRSNPPQYYKRFCDC